MRFDRHARSAGWWRASQRETRRRPRDRLGPGAPLAAGGVAGRLAGTPQVSGPGTLGGGGSARVVRRPSLRRSATPWRAQRTLGAASSARPRARVYRGRAAHLVRPTGLRPARVSSRPDGPARPIDAVDRSSWAERAPCRRRRRSWRAKRRAFFRAGRRRGVLASAPRRTTSGSARATPGRTGGMGPIRPRRLNYAEVTGAAGDGRRSSPTLPDRPGAARPIRRALRGAKIIGGRRAPRLVDTMCASATPRPRC